MKQSCDTHAKVIKTQLENARVICCRQKYATFKTLVQIAVNKNATFKTLVRFAVSKNATWVRLLVGARSFLHHDILAIQATIRLGSYHLPRYVANIGSSCKPKQTRLCI